jgi:hypothetical protein
VTMHGHHVGEFLGKQPTGEEFATKQIYTYLRFIRRLRLARHYPTRTTTTKRRGRPAD